MMWCVWLTIRIPQCHTYIFMCVCANRKLWGPLSEQRYMSTEWKWLPTMPLSAPVHWQNMWNRQVSLLSWRRVYPQRQFFSYRELHLPVNREYIYLYGHKQYLITCQAVSPVLLLLTTCTLFHRCTNGRIQPSCYTCDTNEYCANGQCSINPITRLPECRWRAEPPNE